MKRPNKTKQNKKTPPNCHFWRAGSQNRGSEQKQCIAYLYMQPAMQETPVQFVGQEDRLEKG